MLFNHAQVKSVKGDFAKGEIQITVSVPFDKENSVIASELSLYADPEAGSVTVDFAPRQMAFKTIVSPDKQ